MMKKMIALMLALVLCFTLFAGCSKDKADEPATPAVIDYSAAFAKYDPDTVVMTVDGVEVTWSEYFYMLWKEFDECVTPEARLANAADRIQPFMNNAVTTGHTWRLGNVTLSQVMKRTGLVFEVLPALEEYVMNVIDDAVERGWIIKD